MGRNLMIMVLVSLSVFLACASPKQTEQPPLSDCTLWYQQPAERWREALPLGNGRLGAMVFGAVDSERIQLNEESLWAGTRTDPYPENPWKYLEQVRKLLVERKPVEANEIMLKHMTARPTSFRSYEPLGDLLMDFTHEGEITDYRRELDMRTGTMRIEYKAGDVRYHREMFISAPDDVLVLRIGADRKGAVNGSIGMTRKKDAQVSAVSDSELLLDGQVVDIEAPEAYDDNPGGSGPGGEHMKFAARLRAENSGGEIRASSDRIIVSGADEITILLTAATDYDLDMMMYNRAVDPAGTTHKILDVAETRSYDSLRARHTEEHQAMFDRVDLTLDNGEKSAIPTDKRLAAAKEGTLDNGLIAQYFQFGRYILMSSSRRPGKLPANLQGVWNEEMWAPWEADYHLNINLQMNYWPAEICNLSETVYPLTDWMAALAERGKVTAERMYGTEGWMSYTSTNVWGRVTPAGSTPGSQVDNGYCDPLAGAWMSLTLWRHYEYTLDRCYLERIYPILKGASEFILGYLIEDSSGYLVTAPANSPENNYIDPASGKSIRITLGTTYSSQISRALFNACIDAAAVLGRDNDFSQKLAGTIKRLPPNRIGADGTLMEWLEDYKEPEPGHRHFSHLFGLYPGNEINAETPEIFEAARNAIDRRLENGGGQTGWSRAWLVSFAARFLDGDEALAHIGELLRLSTFDNMFDRYPPDLFQIDGNFGATAGIAEMLVQSHMGELYLLPALPAAWAEGSVRGLRTRGAFEVDIVWSGGAMTKAAIRSLEGGECKVRYGGKTVTLQTEKGGEYVLNGELVKQ